MRDTSSSSSHTSSAPSVSPFRVWVWAIRPRTLPLAASAITLGYGLAAMYGPARPGVFGLCVLTALLLQILSNLANDYGDAVAGTDGADRLGPSRMVGSGLASPRRMLQAVLLAAGLTLAAGLALVVTAAWGDWPRLAFFLLLGLACVAAAVMYTMGTRPYGYMGLGDLMAGLFFGPVAVLGSAFLCGSVAPAMWLPGVAAGLCSTAVLNINNMRDITTDSRAGKRTVAVRLGLDRARVYHACLCIGTLGLWALFCLLRAPWLLAGLVLAAPLARSTWLAVTRADDPACLNAQLRHTVIGSAVLNGGMGLLCLWAG